MTKRFSLRVLAYLLPTFALGVQWVMVGPLTTLAFAGMDRKVPAVT